jgi:hypothetical protein
LELLPQPTPSTSQKLELIIPSILTAKPNKEQKNTPQVQKIDIIVPKILLQKPQRLELQVATPLTKILSDPRIVHLELKNHWTNYECRRRHSIR